MIGDKIKKIRKELNMTQKDLASKSGLTRESIGNYERGDRTPDINSMTKIAEALNSTVNDLLGLDLTNNTEVSNFLYDEKQNRLISILKLYDYEVFDDFKVLKDDFIKTMSEEAFNNMESFIKEYIKFKIGK